MASGSQSIQCFNVSNSCAVQQPVVSAINAKLKYNSRNGKPLVFSDSYNDGLNKISLKILIKQGHHFVNGFTVRRRYPEGETSGVWECFGRQHFNAGG